ncbi:hypothetical protein FOCC_FOCC012482 [Frankliniella occidentalis]|nr:hypothetical protein FOCC_FOCC012482 [Frankliniella occidentalis]
MSLSLPLFPRRGRWHRPGHGPGGQSQWSPGRGWTWQPRPGASSSQLSQMAQSALQTLRQMEEEENSSCEHIYVKIQDSEEREGSDELHPSAGPPLGHFCGTKLPPVVTSKSHKVFVTFSSPFMASAGSGFRFEWAAEGCGGDLRRPEGAFTSPNYPQAYPVCEWTITADWASSVELTIWDFNLEHVQECSFDFLAVYGGPDDSSPELVKMCHTETKPTVLTSSGRQMFVRFHSDFSYSGRGFNASYKLVGSQCGGQLSGPNGVIRSPNDTLLARLPGREPSCEWVVTARRGRTLAVTVTSLGIPPEAGDGRAPGTCGNSYLLLKNGEKADSPLLGAGKYCGNDPPASVPETSGNKLYVKFRRHTASAEKSNDCSREVRLGEGDARAISSPNYPSIPEPHVECVWVVVAPPGRRVRLDFTGRFDLTNSPHIASPGYPDSYLPQTRCEWRLEVRPTATMTLQFLDMSMPGLMGRRCPDQVTVISKANPNNPNETGEQQLSPPGVRLFTQKNDPAGGYRGFALRFTANKESCGGVLETPSGTIRSPGYPRHVPRVRCEWTIKAPPGRRVSITFADVDLSNAVHPRYNTQRVWLYHGLADTVPMEAVNYTLPAGSKFESTSNTLGIVLYSNVATANRGFRIDYDTTKDQVCGGPLPEVMVAPLGPPGGNLTSYLCRWDLGAPRPLTTPPNDVSVNATLAVRVRRLDVASKQQQCFKYSTRIVLRRDGVLCSRVQEPVTILSPYTKNVLEVNKPWYLTSGMDFSIEYSWSECGGVLSSPSELTSPGFHSGGYPNATHCAWKVTFEEGEQPVVTFETLDLAQGSCEDYVTVHNGDSAKSPKLFGPACTKPAHPLHAGGRHLWIEFHTGTPTVPRGRGFRMTFSTTSRACGGTFHTAEGTLSSPGFPQAYPANIECVWVVELQPGYRVSVTFEGRFNIQSGPDLSHDYLQVTDYDEARGEWSPTSRMFHGRTALDVGEVLESSGSRLRFVFHSDGGGSAEGFKARNHWESLSYLTVARWKAKCGYTRTLVGREARGEVVSPGFPVAYAPELNCSYELRAPGQVILAKFTNFSVEAGRASDPCKFDNVTILKSEGEFLDVGSLMSGRRNVFCDLRPPPGQIRVKDKLAFTFQTDRWVNLPGFRMVYQLDTCDQNITEPTIIKSHGEGEEYAPMANCTWNITAPDQHTVRLRFKLLEVEMSYECFSDAVSVFDGPLENETLLLGRFCGNLTHDLPSLRSTGRSLLARWRSDTSVAARGFVAEVSFATGACGLLSRCACSVTTVRARSHEGHKSTRK